VSRFRREESVTPVGGQDIGGDAVTSVKLAGTFLGSQHTSQRPMKALHDVCASAEMTQLCESDFRLGHEKLDALMGERGIWIVG
jgi:hypothetical protein